LVKTRLTSPRILFLIASVALVTAGHYMTGLHLHHVHDVFRRLYYLPIIFGGFWFGLRGGLITATVVSLVFLPHVMFQWQETPFANPEQYLEIMLYLVVGGVTGALSQMEMQRRVELRRANQKLEDAYHQLQEQSMSLVKAEEQLRLADRLATLGELSASMAHEIRNPLGGIKGAAEIFRDSLGAEHRLHEFAQILVKETDRLNEILTRFLDLARPKQADLGRADAQAVVDELLRLAGVQARRSHVEIAAQIEAGLAPMHIAPSALGQILLNLVLNAIQAMPGGGKITIAAHAGPAEKLRRADAPAFPVAHISVMDTGPGVPPEARQRVFDPFYTTKKGGTGLGLAICQRIVRAFRGSIDLDPEAPAGACFVIELPFVPTERESP
jgi:signal transduction histidine kinase